MDYSWGMWYCKILENHYLSFLWLSAGFLKYWTPQQAQHCTCLFFPSGLGQGGVPADTTPGRARGRARTGDPEAGPTVGTTGGGTVTAIPPCLLAGDTLGTGYVCEAWVTGCVPWETQRGFVKGLCSCRFNVLLSVSRWPVKNAHLWLAFRK